jgi:6,7-dimethyl-8-ribityllumazine synthase
MQKAVTADFEPFNASSWRIGVVVSEFNGNITGKLRDGALKRAAEYQIPKENIEIISVAGAVEIPLALQHLAKKNKYDALLAIGCVIRGETPHFEYVCDIATQGVLQVQLDHSIAIGFGVLTCDDASQAEARTNLGGGHLDAALHLAKVLKD